ncbi:hypothetical protein LINGRAHAP2_LOCUS22383, partial [Linum grandiflorum]
MCARSWIQDEGRGAAATAKAMAELEGVFSSLTMDDPTVKDGIDALEAHLNLGDNVVAEPT